MAIDHRTLSGLVAAQAVAFQENALRARWTPPRWPSHCRTMTAVALSGTTAGDGSVGARSGCKNGRVSSHLDSERPPRVSTAERHDGAGVHPADGELPGRCRSTSRHPRGYASRASDGPGLARRLLGDGFIRCATAATRLRMV